MVTSIGRMRHRVTIQSPTATVDTGGGRSIAWGTLKEVFADIQPVSASYKYKHGQETEEVTHKVIIRHRTDIGTNYRIKFGTRIFNIMGIINPDERDRFLELNCTEGAAT
mgnify:CR=1 FL=1